MEEEIRRAAEENLGNILSKTEINDKLPLKSKLWARLNPAYEAIVSAFMRNVKDDELIAKIIENLKKIDEVGGLMAIQSIMGMLSGERSKIIESELKKGTPIEEITIRAALELAENKRTQNGSILYRVDGQNPDKFFMKALKKANLYNIYIEVGEIDKIKRNREKIKKIDKIKKIIIATLAGVGILGGIYLFKNRYTIGDYLTAYYTPEEVKKIK